MIVFTASFYLLILCASLLPMNHHAPSGTVSGLPFEDCLLHEEVEEFALHTSMVNFEKREVIFRQNTPVSHVMFVKSGFVKVYKEGYNKRSVILKIATAGEFLGLMSVYGGIMHQFSASSVQNAEIGFIDLGVADRIIKRNGDFAAKIIESLSRDGLFIFERIMNQTYKQLPGRMAAVILYFSEIIFKQQVFDFPLTRRELAELAGTTKESFIRTLAEFKNDKIIDLEGSRVSINSMKIIRTLNEKG
ncbi:MAG TPA: Crp/Fnr family transcriptional regulator [Bacteroidales bacterium]|nr:Crp/Fnr family transcriptional regulator [Bacteroidales bacterium]